MESGDNDASALLERLSRELSDTRRDKTQLLLLTEFLFRRSGSDAEKKLLTTEMQRIRSKNAQLEQEVARLSEKQPVDHDELRDALAKVRGLEDCIDELRVSMERSRDELQLELRDEVDKRRALSLQLSLLQVEKDSLLRQAQSTSDLCEQLRIELGERHLAVSRLDADVLSLQLDKQSLQEKANAEAHRLETEFSTRETLQRRRLDGADAANSELKLKVSTLEAMAKSYQQRLSAATLEHSNAVDALRRESAERQRKDETEKAALEERLRILQKEVAETALLHRAELAECAQREKALTLERNRMAKELNAIASKIESADAVVSTVAELRTRLEHAEELVHAKTREASLLSANVERLRSESFELKLSAERAKLRVEMLEAQKTMLQAS